MLNDDNVSIMTYIGNYLRYLRIGISIFSSGHYKMYKELIEATLKHSNIGTPRSFQIPHRATHLLDATQKIYSTLGRQRKYDCFAIFKKNCSTIPCYYLDWALELFVKVTLINLQKLTNIHTCIRRHDQYINISFSA